MAYIQITTRCNMTCEHCCHSCTSKGEDMTAEIYKLALALDEETVSIGGGEPTIHPKFWEFIGLALGNVEYVWLATNGSVKDTALALARMAKKEVLGCDLSQDEFHDYDMVDDDVREAFGNLKHGIRDVTLDGSKDPILAGRFRQYAEDCGLKGSPGCVCEDYVIKPNGDVMVCGCDDAPLLGNLLNEGFDIHQAMTDKYGEDYEQECWHNQPVAELA